MPDEDHEGLLFKPTDINVSTNTMTRLLRSIFVSKKLTVNKLKDKFMAHMGRAGASSNCAGYSWNNLMKSLAKDKTTWSMLFYILESILNLHIVKRTITTVNEEGAVEEHKLDL